MVKCYIVKMKTGTFCVIDAKYGCVQGTYPDEAFAFIAASKMGYVVDA